MCLAATRRHDVASGVSPRNRSNPFAFESRRDDTQRTMERPCRSVGPTGQRGEAIWGLRLMPSRPGGPKDSMPVVLTTGFVPSNIDQGLGRTAWWAIAPPVLGNPSWEDHRLSSPMITTCKQAVSIRVRSRERTIVEQLSSTALCLVSIRVRSRERTGDQSHFCKHESWVSILVVLDQWLGQQGRARHV